MGIMTKHSAIGTVVEIIGLLAFALVTTIFVSCAYSNMGNMNSTFHKIVRNWDEDIIADVKVVAAAAKCPTGYTPGLNYYWAGIQEYCDCQKASMVGGFEDESCSWAQKLRGKIFNVLFFLFFSSNINF